MAVEIVRDELRRRRVVSESNGDCTRLKWGIR